MTEANGDFISGLENGLLDLALDRFPDASAYANSKKFFSCELIAERQCILTSLDDSLAALNTVELSQLEGKTIITSLENSPEDRMTLQAFQSRGIKWNKIYRSDGIDTIMMLVERGNGVTLGPLSFAKYFGIKAIPIVPESYLSMSFVCLRERMREPEFRLLKDYLLRICRRLKEEA
nr:LysR family transcriptional regulator substrate-binding protein [uncultured Oscillibacter sp.]